MSRRKPDQGEYGKRRSGLVRFARRRGPRPSYRHKGSNSFRSFVLRIANLATLCALAFVGWSADISRAQVSDAERASYADALAYCRGFVGPPVVLRSDKRVLCLDGLVTAPVDLWTANSLERGGLFVVRGYGGDISATIALSDILLIREATVIVNDYCLATCANYLFIASLKSFVPKDALVAWINHPTGPNNCIGFFETGDRNAPRLQQEPCAFPMVDSNTKELIRLKKKFYEARALSLEEPPESIAIRRVLKRKFDATGRYPDNVYWTWNPRYYASAMRTKVLYEAYPQSQDELDAIVARIGLPSSVIYDP